MNRVDKLKQKKQDADKQSEKFAAELEHLTYLSDPDNGGNLAHYDVDKGRVDIYGPSDREQVTISKVSFKRLVAWGNKLFTEA